MRAPADAITPAGCARQVAVIIPTLNRDDLLEKCLASLAQQTLLPQRILVVDNSTRTEPPAFLARFPRTEYVSLGENRGTAGAFNRGLDLCKAAPYILLLNNDAELERTCLAELVEPLDGDTSSFAVPRLLQAARPELLDGVGDEMILGGGAFRVGHNERDAGQYDARESVLSACGAAVLMRRAAAEDVGGFDEDFFAYREDVDFCLRAQWRGHHCLYVPNARGRHVGSATLGSTFHPRIMRLSSRNQICLVIKNYSWPMLVRLLPRLAMFQLLWAGLAVSKGAFLSYCVGILEAILLLPTMWARRRAILGGRRISDNEMLARLHASEARIWRWQTSPYNARPSKLLGTYFRIFGAPREARPAAPVR